MSRTYYTLLCLLAAGCFFGQGCRTGQTTTRPEVSPAPPAAQRIAHIPEIETVVNEEIQAGHFPGAVVLIGNRRQILYCRSFGSRSLVPEKTKMTPDCVFDVASLSKPVSTAACIHLLIDRGQLSLDTYVADIIPAFSAHGKQAVQIRHLLSHTSGLPAYTDAASLEEKFGHPCPQQVLERICALEPEGRPGQQFRYSCLGYITLGKIVEIVSGRGLDVFARQNLFIPLGMSDTSYNPEAALKKRIAPTEMKNGRCLLGQVHDPLAGLMGGVSGNAGVFSTAEDLSRYCTMLLNDGRFDGRQILSPNAVKDLTEPRLHGRAYGFDVHSAYAWIKGDRLSDSTFCHSGFTGTSIVCDPVNDLYVIILTNSVHPDGKGSTKNVRVQIANLAADFFLTPATR